MIRWETESDRAPTFHFAAANKGNPGPIRGIKRSHFNNLHPFPGEIIYSRCIVEQIILLRVPDETLTTEKIITLFREDFFFLSRYDFYFILL